MSLRLAHMPFCCFFHEAAHFLSSSVLGIYIDFNNLSSQNIQSQVRLFADDTAVYLTVSSLQNSQFSSPI